MVKYNYKVKHFKVKKGNKFFWGPRWDFFKIKKNSFNLKVFFHGNCVYQLKDNYDQINKLSGESLRIFPWYDKLNKKIKPGHQKDSVRFGWRCINGRDIELLSYVYIDGSRVHKKICNIDVNQLVHLNFEYTEDYYIFRVLKDDGESFISKINKPRTKKSFTKLFTNRLYPYFGGAIASPRNMDITIKNLKKFI
jgi:hypothetical protein